MFTVSSKHGPKVRLFSESIGCSLGSVAQCAQRSIFRSRGLAPQRNSSDRRLESRPPDRHHIPLAAAAASLVHCCHHLGIYRCPSQKSSTARPPPSRKPAMAL